MPARGKGNFGELAQLDKDEWLTLCVWTGWDPIFEYEGQTYAEMDKSYKVDPPARTGSSKLDWLTSE